MTEPAILAAVAKAYGPSVGGPHGHPPKAEADSFIAMLEAALGLPLADIRARLAAMPDPMRGQQFEPETHSNFIGAPDPSSIVNAELGRMVRQLQVGDHITGWSGEWRVVLRGLTEFRHADLAEALRSALAARAEKERP